MTRPTPWARLYFAAQSAAGALWWVAVFTVPGVRTATLGHLDPVPVALFDVPLFVVASALAATGSNGGRRRIMRGAAVVASGWTVLVAAALAAYATVTQQAGWGVLIMIAAATGSVLAAFLLVRGSVPTRWVIAGPFGFRPANLSRSAAANVAATFAQVALFWGLFLLVIPGVIVWFEQRWQVGIPTPSSCATLCMPLVASVGWVVLAVASALGVWAAVTMSTLGLGTPLPAAMPNRLVVAGPYRWVRNPMALAGIAQGVAVGLITASWLVVIYALAGSLVWNHIVRPYEEADLEKRFGAAFLRYRMHVRCWVPRFTPVARS